MTHPVLACAKLLVPGGEYGWSRQVNWQIAGLRKGRIEVGQDEFLGRSGERRDYLANAEGRGFTLDPSDERDRVGELCLSRTVLRRTREGLKPRRYG